MGTFQKLSLQAAAAWPILRIGFCLVALLSFLAAARAGALQHREALQLARDDGRQLAGRVDSLQDEFKRLRLEAQTYYDCGEYGYQKVYQLMRSRKFTAAFNAWALKNLEHEKNERRKQCLQR